MRTAQYLRRSRRRIVGDAVTVVLDATGLDEAQRSALEEETIAVLKAAGAATVRLAFTAERSGPTVIAVASGKGGVGKSTLAANLAVALAEGGAEVGLVDADIHGPSLPLLMGTGAARPSAVGERLQPLRAHGVRVLSLGAWLCFGAGRGAAGMWWGLVVALVVAAAALGWRVHTVLSRRLTRVRLDAPEGVLPHS